jgi:glutamyl-tRNA reductase
MAMIDIAVPRDIEPQVSDLSDVFLYTVDDLSEIIDRGMQARKQAAEKAEHIIEHQASDFMRKMRGLSAGSTIAELRSQAGTLQQQTLEKALAMIAKGEAPEKALQYYAHTFTNKLLHKPSAELRAASEAGDETLIRSTRQLFDLDIGNNTSGSDNGDHNNKEAQPDKN